ncbi:putative Glycogen debranching enzyme [Venustampulla echinocandica]|uniref:Glycogen debranching enzyme n=1 Tax=Venustampulla echinocandica TaxID=2656787 RepID=A0A370TWX9_9HELO|nr:putative Glycogen debranching enzyme [Venustampulla echinocandica]RDL40032.1 putative Glycogen debranching enzyme [Venustampulla echinocandica]
MVPDEVYLLPLKDDGSPDVSDKHQYIYLTPKTSAPIIVRFQIEGTSSICRHGRLWVNIPEEGAEFRRDNFRAFKLEPDFNRTIEISIPIHGAGAFAFYTTYHSLPDLSETTIAPSTTSRTPTYYIDIAPRLTLGGTQMPLPAVSVFSLISKFMGKYPADWEKHLRGIDERGYNMVHFTPLQQRGESNSPYSIYDQLKWDPECFPNGEADIKKLIDSMENKYNLLALTDVVFNHTANNSKWLHEHPEAGYNVSTAPWLRSALELDTELLEFSKNMAKYDLPTTLTSVDDLLKIMDSIKEKVIAKLRLWEFYVVHAERNADAAIEAWATGDISFPKDGFGDPNNGGLEAIKSAGPAEQAQLLIKHGMLDNDRLGERFRRKVNPPVAAALLTAIYGRFEGDDSDSADRAAARNHFVKVLDELNLPLYREYDVDVAELLQQVFNRVKYVRLDEHGPKLGPIDMKNPLIESYFTRLPKNSITSKHKEDDLALVNNGWIWAANALVDHAGPKSRAYLRREVIVWGDCVKLRYGSGREDSPFLWDFMASYARLMAKYFTGFRIDNCHSTPIHVAEFLLDEARRVRPNLFIVAELFTGSEETDYIFVKRLGLSSLIREAMQAWGTGELSRLVHQHGGRPIGSFEADEVSGADSESLAGSQPAKREIVRQMKYTPVHALFMDCTHDNEPPAQKRDARDTLPNTALVNMCASSTGSVFGYDEIYPELIDLVGETRLYSSISSTKPVEIGGGEGGIGGIKKLLNQIHTLMGKDGYDETHIHHEDQYITVHRVHPESRKGYFLIAHTAFPGYGDGNGELSPVRLTGTKARHVGSWMLEVDTSEEAKKAASEDKKFLRGLPSKVSDLPGVRLEIKENETVITIPDKFPPGSIALFETWIPSVDHSSGLDTYVTSGAKAAFSELDLVDLNFVLYRCEAEELDSSDGKNGVYDIPEHGKLVYAGLQGWWSVMKDVIRNNNLAHPICRHLRDGQWPLDYMVGRLERISERVNHERLCKPAEWLKERFAAIRKIPSFLLPRYFGLVLRTAYMAAWDRSLELMNDNVQKGQWFLQSLAMVSLQQVGFVKSASLYPKKDVPSLAAGLPHFAVSWARCWGRDVFISARGLLLGAGRYAECREHILAFASVMKHGMIPNLLSSGSNPRYNARDAIWFMLQTIQDYTKIVPNGLDILKEKIPRRFLPYDDTYFEVDDPRAYSKSSTLEDIVQEALQRHATGMSFREANAGPDLDMQMKPEGFQQDIKVDWSTGIIFGGNQYNCGTWMDKMGESEKAHNKGVPGTPRDGAAIEITGLHYSTLVWLAKLHKEGKYKYAGVSTSDPNREVITFGDWSALIKHNFERCYYIPVDSDDDDSYDVNPKIINRRGVYKDLYKSGKEYEDYQLRPNFTIAMAVAPDIFNDTHALHALTVADKVLRGPTGMATLDPSDLNYHPYYINSDDSDNFSTSKGRNYHQGPEWLWPTGFFLRALLKFDLKRCDDPGQKTEAFQQITKRLIGCKEAIKESPWAGLTELTNKNGEVCGDSSPTQAWSAGCLIDLYHDAAQYDVSQLSS